MTTQLVGAKEYRARCRQLVEQLLDYYLPSSEEEPRRLHEAMRYSVMAGGKRIRPILALAAYEYCQGTEVSIESPIGRAMASLEIIHTYSLIHDDLPCMDDDDLRRGLPTCHKKFGEALAVLAGDALHVVGFRLMAETGNLSALLELSEAIGTTGMIGGQVADLEAEGVTLTEQRILEIHRQKTAALIRASVRIGALLGGADSKTLGRLTLYGESIGLCFQIVDDILDIEGDQTKTGKLNGSDHKNRKATYPAVVGMSAARDRARGLVDDALAVFKPYEDNALVWMAHYIGQRDS